MTRKQLLQYLIDQHGYESYLEIGVFNGQTFLPIDCKKKVAVDPFFRIKKLDKLKWAIKKPANLSNEYYQMKSDDFFGSAPLLQKHSPFDLVFIDGLHTFKASLKDSLNAMRNLNLEGTIVLHDCFPPHKAAETPAESFEEARKKSNRGWTGEWCGDVWKTIYYLKMKYEEKIEIFVLDSDYGLGVLRIKNRELDLNFDELLFSKISSLTYAELKSDPEKMINIKPRTHVSLEKKYQTG